MNSMSAFASLLRRDFETYRLSWMNNIVYIAQQENDHGEP